MTIMRVGMHSKVKRLLALFVSALRYGLRRGRLVHFGGRNAARWWFSASRHSSSRALARVAAQQYNEGGDGVCGSALPCHASDGERSGVTHIHPRIGRARRERPARFFQKEQLWRIGFQGYQCVKQAALIARAKTNEAGPVV